MDAITTCYHLIVDAIPTRSIRAWYQAKPPLALLPKGLQPLAGIRVSTGPALPLSLVCVGCDAALLPGLEPCCYVVLSAASWRYQWLLQCSRNCGVVDDGAESCVNCLEGVCKT